MTPPSGLTQLSFSDDFDGSTLDATKWAASGPNENRYGQETWDQGHATLANSLLTLRATPDFHSGEVRSLLSLPRMGYGYHEVKAWVPSSKPGLWAGAWLVTIFGSTSQQSRQEVDFLEDDSYSQSFVGENLHWGVAGAIGGLNGGWFDPNVNFTQGFHTYGVLYLADRIDFYVDDVVRLHRPQQVPPMISDPMQLRLSLSIFGKDQASYALPPDSGTTWPADYVIDWWRFWTQPVVTRRHHWK